MNPGVFELYVYMLAICFENVSVWGGCFLQMVEFPFQEYSVYQDGQSNIKAHWSKCYAP